MARISNSMFSLHGKVGDLIFRTVNGRVYIVSNGNKLPMPMDEKSVTLRNKFSLCQKLSTSVRKNPNLFSIWRSFTGSPNPRHIIFKEFYPLINGNDISRINLLPSHNFVFSAKSIRYENNIFSVIVNPLGEQSGIFCGTEVQIAMHASLISFSDSDIASEQYGYIPLSSFDQKCILDTELSFELPLSPIQNDMLANCSYFKLLIVLVTYDINKNPVKNSCTLIF